MLKYALLNLVFLLPVAVIAWRARLPKNQLIPLLAGMLLLTVIFDSLIIGLDIVRYYSENISGLYIGKAPIEDFAYTIAAVILVPVLWSRKWRRKNRA